MFGYDKKVEAALLTGGVFDITRVEQFLLSFNKNPDAPNLDYSTQSHGPRAPEIVNPSGFINTDNRPITIGEFKGKKVVLIDFWTYSCINCQRTLPYVKSWYDKYKDQGLEVISIHTPEFSFEKVQSNVQNYVTGNNIKYPVVLDNDYSTWNAFGNQYWPRKYLINQNGEIIYDHIGEGDYDKTEEAIQKALAELNQTQNTGVEVSSDITTPPDQIPMDGEKIGSPETYFGSSRNTYLANGIPGRAGEQTLKLPSTFDLNNLYLEGTWQFSQEFASAETSGKIVFPYSAKNVYMVASANSPITVSIIQDGKKIKDLTISANTLYHIIDGADYGTHTLEIDTPPGLNAFTFTFG
jgi:thiol-disulfide isomerase/thioredoxin